MNKLDELRQAFNHATPGEWAVKQEREYRACNSRVLCDKGYTVAEGYSSDSATTKTYNELWTEAEGNTNFIALSHNLMPQLLEAVERVEAFQSVCSELTGMNPFLAGEFYKNKTVLEKLK